MMTSWKSSVVQERGNVVQECCARKGWFITGVHERGMWCKSVAQEGECCVQEEKLLYNWRLGVRQECCAIIANVYLGICIGWSLPWPYTHGALLLWAGPLLCAPDANGVGLASVVLVYSHVAQNGAMDESRYQVTHDVLYWHLFSKKRGPWTISVICSWNQGYHRGTKG